MLRLLHTSDWHLGHWLHELSREHEHDRFLAWLLDTLEAERIDALLVAGDVFETASPPVHATAQWFRFLATARRRLPELDIAVIAGNHDSPSRLDAPTPMFRALGIHVIGALPDDPADMLAPLRDADGAVRAWVAAVPFLRPGDLPRSPQPVDDPLIEGVRLRYAEVLDAARARREPGQALIAMGHCYMVGSELSGLSERRILGGNQHALPIDIFPDDVAYAALGHLHKPQRVGKREHVRYSGAPIPLAMNEALYRHQVLVVELDGDALREVRSVEVPRAVEMLRVPAQHAAPLAEVLDLLRALPERDDRTPEHQRPYLEVRVSLPRPEPSLRRDVEDALDGKQARLVKLEVVHTGDGQALADAEPATNLRDLAPEEVFLRCYQRAHEEPPSAELLHAFHELLDAVHQGASK